MPEQVLKGCLYLLDWTAGLDCWNGLLDWTAGMDYWTGLLEWISWTGLLDLPKLPQKCLFTVGNVLIQPVTLLIG